MRKNKSIKITPTLSEISITATETVTVKISKFYSKLIEANDIIKYKKVINHIKMLSL